MKGTFVSAVKSVLVRIRGVCRKIVLAYRISSGKICDKKFYDLCSNVIRRFFHLKPVLSFLEVHLTDHCNMNCSGCAHFCPLADVFFANIEQYDRDMKQLSRLLSNIRMIQLIGGEPLLHPNVSMFLDSTRRWFPKANIQLFTNGILLSNMPKEFWESCRRNSISIHLSLYPPLFIKEADFLRLAKSEGITLNISKTSTFRLPTNSKGDSDLEKGFNRCRKWLYVPILKEGKVYPCAKPAYVHYFNREFGTDIPSTGFVDLYDPKVTGWEVLSRINKIPEACRYCTYGWEEIPTQAWSKSRHRQEEWDITNQK